MITDFGDDMHCQFLEILRSLLDSYASGSQVPWLSKILSSYTAIILGLRA